MTKLNGFLVIKFKKLFVKRKGITQERLAELIEIY